MHNLYKLELYVPKQDVERIKKALFDIGVGKVGNYDCCCWQTEGVGQFRPLYGAKPAVGKIGSIEYAVEFKLEFVFPYPLKERVVETIKKVHPYETPAYAILPIES